MSTAHLFGCSAQHSALDASPCETLQVDRPAGIDDVRSGRRRRETMTTSSHGDRSGRPVRARCMRTQLDLATWRV
uniref:Uncharacterized protein n=1 Tax=Arundo donax TaxID=35708 RepID=A0A0A9B9P4_ARUDO